MVQVIAHRGARSLAPENTLAAARRAFELGADLWETDVQQTCDGHLVLFHDQTLERCTNVGTVFPDQENNSLSQFDLKQLGRLDAGSFFCDHDPFGQIAKGRVPKEALAGFAIEPIPTLDSALAFTKSKKWKVNLELKSYPGQDTGESLPLKIIRALEQCGIDKGNVVVSSFYHPWLDFILANDPDIEVQALVGEDDSTSLDFGDFRFHTYNINTDLVTKQQINDLKKRGKTINLFTVNEPRAFNVFCDMGVDGIITDFPQVFVDSVVSR